MPFEIDLQTLLDLEVFHEKPSQQNIFSYFNQTKTFGGKLQLKKLMEDPLDNLTELEERRDIIRYFRDFNFSVSINAGQMDFIDHYFRLNKSPLQNNFLDGFISRFWVNQSAKNDMYLIQTGVEKLVYLILDIEKWLLETPVTRPSFPLKKALSFFNSYLQLPGISQMVQQVKAKPKTLQAYRFDHLFRTKYKKETQQLVQSVYEFDAYNAVALTANRDALTFPEYVDSPTPQLELKGLFHPLIKQPVSNDWSMTSDQNLCFLSGPNMAGKSTFLKSLGLAVYLAHLGFPVPAAMMQTSVYQGLISTINLSDNMGRGYSHFYAEVKRIKEVALKIKNKKRLFVIFDELFRGTNVKDAYDASLLVIESFADIKQSTFFISTHITEIADMLKDKPNILFKYFDVKIVDGQPIYSYRLQKGVSHERLGMLIVRNEKIVETLQGL